MNSIPRSKRAQGNKLSSTSSSWRWCRASHQPSRLILPNSNLNMHFSFF